MLSWLVSGGRRSLTAVFFHGILRCMNLGTYGLDKKEESSDGNEKSGFGLFCVRLPQLHKIGE